MSTAIKIHLGKTRKVPKYEAEIAPSPANAPKMESVIEYPSLFIDDVASPELANIPKSGRATIEFETEEVTVRKGSRYPGEKPADNEGPAVTVRLRIKSITPQGMKPIGLEEKPESETAMEELLEQMDDGEQAGDEG